MEVCNVNGVCEYTLGKRNIEMITHGILHTKDCRICRMCKIVYFMIEVTLNFVGGVHG